MHLLKFLLLCASVWGCAVTADVQAAEIKIIANPSVKASELSAEELKRVFLIKTNSLPDGSHIEPVIGLSEPAYEIFLKQYLGKTDAALNTYYRSLVFTGKAFMPKLLASEAEVIAYVAKTKGAIGYVSTSADTAGLKSVLVK